MGKALWESKTHSSGLMVARNHDRYLEQAKWTASLRDFLFSSIQLPSDSRILEVGSGTGVIINDLSNRLSARYIGVDKDYSPLPLARSSDQGVDFINGLAEQLPFPDEVFDLVFCHYFLIWIVEPKVVLKEIIRVLKNGGVFMALAEPDYSARVDAPENLVPLGKLQNLSLKNQGCQLDTGRNLPALFSRSGFSQVRFGLSGFETRINHAPDWLASEWETLNSDLSTLCTSEELSTFRRFDENAWSTGERVLWVPTFYAVGRKLI